MCWKNLVYETHGERTRFFPSTLSTIKINAELLSPDGSILVHCDWRLNSNIRLVLDEVFGNGNLKRDNLVKQKWWAEEQTFPGKNMTISILFKIRRISIFPSKEKSFMGLRLFNWQQKCSLVWRWWRIRSCISKSIPKDWWKLGCWQLHRKKETDTQPKTWRTWKNSP